MEKLDLKRSEEMKRKIAPPTEMVSPNFSMSLNEQEVLNLTGVTYQDINFNNKKNNEEFFPLGDVFQGDWSNNWAPVNLIENKEQE
jgi:hypothetical protein